MADATKAVDSIQSDAMTSAAFEENYRKTKKVLPALLIVFTLGSLMTQAMYLVYQNIGDSLNMSSMAPMLSTIPGIVLGVVCMLYGTLCDFISPKKLTIFGVAALVVGGAAGFLGASNFWIVLIACMLQTAGGQVAGSVFLVLAVKYLTPKEKAVWIGVFNAIYYLAAALGIFAGGLITSIDYRYLFFLPLLSVVFFPILIKNTPDISGTSEHIDYFGIILFAIIAGLVAVYFSFSNMWLLVAAIVLLVVFGVYVVKGKKPFLSVKFLTNKPYMVLIVSILLFYFFSSASVPIYNVIGDSLYHISLSQVSIYLTIVYLVATAVAIGTGPIINAIGRERTIVLSASLMAVGFAGSALFIKSGFVVLTILACVFIGGLTMAYTPLYDSASDALPAEERGRGVGISDLMMNISASIGMAVYSMLMANSELGKKGLFGAAAGTEATVSNMFWIMAALSVVTIVIYLSFRRSINNAVAKAAAEQD